MFPALNGDAKTCHRRGTQNLVGVLDEPIQVDLDFIEKRHHLSISGVAFFVINGEIALCSAQPPEMF